MPRKRASTSLLHAWRFLLGKSLVFFALVYVALAACGGDSTESADGCRAGETRECVGPGACKGGQACSQKRTWSDCDCGGAGDGGGAGGGSSVEGGGGAQSGGAGGSGGSAAADAASGAGGVGGSTAAGGTAGTPADAGGDSLLPAICKALPGPAMVDMGGWCIDSTEVTQAQYAAFLAAKAGDTSGQPSNCKTANLTFDPTTASPACAGIYDPIGTADWPVRCVYWCDARAYCEWAGKRLCGDVNGGALTSTTAKDPSRNQFLHACSNAGLTTYPYGNTYIESKCHAFTMSAVKANTECHGISPPFSSVYDMTNYVTEWIDYCAASSECVSGAPTPFFREAA